MTDEELAARVGVDPQYVPVMRGASDLNEAREYADAAREAPQIGRPTDGPRDARPVQGARRPAAQRSRPRAEGRRRQPESAPARADRPRQGSRALRDTGCTAQGGSTAPCRSGSTARSAVGSRSSRRRRGRSACTSAARPCTRASTSGTRGRSCSRCGCGAGCARAGTRSRSSTTSPTSTTRSTRRPGGSGSGRASSPAEATQWFLDDTSDLGLGRPDVEPRASETIPEIIAFIEALVADGKAYESQGSVYFRVAAYPDYGQLSGARLEDMVAQEPNPAKEDERDFALWKAQKPHEDAAWDSPWGPGRPGLAHRVLGDGREAPRAGVRDPRRRARPALPPPRERARAVAGRAATRSRTSGCTTGCSSSATRRCRSRSGTSSRCGTCSTRGGARCCCSTT